MSDRDLLERGASAWRAQHGGECSSSGLTRARVLDQLRRKQRRRRFGWWFLSPVPLLMAGSAWAEATDAWPAVLQPVRTQVVALAQSVGLKRPPSASSAPREAPPSVDPNAPSEQSTATKASASAHSPPSGSAHPLSTGSAHPPPSGSAHPSSTGSQESHPPSSGAKASHSPPSGPTRPPSAGSNETRSALNTTVDPPSEAPRDPELTALRQAHDAHFVSGSLSRAKRAYQRYLAQYPSGRFVPEARYNLALLQLRSGEARAAKPVLEAFARGAHGGYRQAEAKALLDALERHQPSSVQ